jgi:DNA polymerase-3 subunit epsilon
VGDYPLLVAHNVSFDRKFLDLEFGFIGRARNNEMACSMLASRRVYPDAPNHKLGTLVSYCGIYTDGTFHRALADAEMTGQLWIGMIDQIKNIFGINHVSNCPDLCNQNRIQMNFPAVDIGLPIAHTLSLDI